MELGICRWCRLLSQDLKPSANSTVALQMPIAEKTNNWVNDCIMRCVTFASNVCTGPLKPPSPVQTIHSPPHAHVCSPKVNHSYRPPLRYLTMQHAEYRTHPCSIFPL